MPDPVLGTPEPAPIPAPEPVIPIAPNQTPSEYAAQTSSPEPAPVPETPSTLIRDAMIAQGYDTFSGVESDQEALDLLGDLASRSLPQEELDQLRQAKQFAEYAGPQWQEFQKFQAEQQAATPEPEPETPQWGPPPVSDVTQRLVDAGLVTRGTNGLYEAAPQFAQHASELNAYAEWKRVQAERLLADPSSFMDDAGYTKRVTEQLTPLEQRLEAMEKQLNEQRLRDQMTAVLPDYTTQQDDGQQVLNEQGQVFAHFMQQLPEGWQQESPENQERWIQHCQDQTELHFYRQAQQEAVAPVETPAPSPPVVAQPTPEELDAQQKQSFLDLGGRNGATRRPTRAHTQVVEQETDSPANPNETFKEMALRTHAEAGRQLDHN